MERKDAMSLAYDEVRIFDMPALFTEWRCSFCTKKYAVFVHPAKNEYYVIKNVECDDQTCKISGME